MKTYYEMTESVLEKARTEVLKQERRRRNGVFIAASGICAVLLLTVIGAGLKQFSAGAPTLPGEQPGISMDATDPTQPAETQANVKITYLSNVVGQTTEKPMTVGVALPLNGMVWIRDIRGLTEEEVDQVRNDIIAAASEFRLPMDGRSTRLETPAVIAASASNGEVVLDFSNSPKVKSVNFESMGTGHLITGDLLQYAHPKARFSWSIVGSLGNALHYDPTIPLESIRDTVTITVDYVDGTEEIFIFDITVNEEGQIFVTLRGTPTEAV